MHKYSYWLKVDLHLHTDWSRKTKENDYQGDFSVEVLHHKLTENGVEIFSLTDHNIINIEAYEKYYQDYSEDDNPLLLVGVELDIAVLQEDESPRIYHSLLIFNDNTPERAREIYQRLEDKYLQKGLEDKKRELTIDEVVELFSDDDFFFIPHAGNTKSIIDGHRGNIEDAQKMVLLMQSAFEKVPQKAIQKYNEGFNKVLYEVFRNQEDIAYIQFSDNHNINQYPKTHKGGTEAPLHDFYYVKGSKNYETLRLAFIDPKSRIKSLEEFQEINTLANRIEKIKIANEQKIEDIEIYFSPHLNVIIGGRSSGKSLLMNVLGSKIDKVTLENHYEISDENFMIKSKVDDDYKQKTSISDDFIYINQGDIVRYFEKDDLKLLAKDSRKTEKYTIAESSILNHKQTLESLVSDLVNSYDELLGLGSQVKYEFHQSTITNIFSAEYMLSLDENRLKEEHIKSESILSAKTLLADLSEKTNEFKSNKIYEFVSDEIITIDFFLMLLETKTELIELKGKSDTKKLDFIKKVKSLIDGKNSGLSQGAQKKASSKENLHNLKQGIKEKFQKAVSLKKCSDVIESFNYETEEEVVLSEDISLVLNVEKEKEIKETILEGINKSDVRNSLYLNLLELSNNQKSIKNLGGNSKEKLKQKTTAMLKDIYQKFDNSKDYLKYSNGTTSKENSPGLNSENYLKVVLKNSLCKMIFIDQPEDNLGNRFISHNLVDIIRDIKFQKQIFLVTHNPAIAVYGDAECIIVAENINNKISYKQIVLEDKNAQKEVCGVLDGGEYIFDNRSRKYNIQRILKETQNG